MYEVTMSEPSRDFLQMWQEAGRQIQSFFQDGLQSWLKVDPSPPFLEHLSFRLGNQVFFIRLEDVDDIAEVPGSHEGLLSVAQGWRGYPCLMPMRRSPRGWQPELPGWGLIDLRTGESVDPASLVSDEPIEITEWELLDFAVQVVRSDLKERSFDIMSSHSNPDVDPNLWFVSNRGLEWVVVRAARYPEHRAERPVKLAAIAQQVTQRSQLGNFASVTFASAENSDSPMWRGHGAEVKYDGLEPLTEPS